MEFLDYMENAELWRKVEYCYKHAYYNPRYIIHDFAVIEMDKPVHYSKSIQPIPMMRNNLGIKFEENGLCLVSGYGLMDYRQPSPTLRMVCVPVVSTARCNRIYGRGTVRSYQVCAGDRGRDSCQGDSGGPLTYHGYLIGIVSYGGRCGEAPGVYSLVSAYTTGENVPFIRNRCIPITYSPLTILLVLVFIYFG
ncbi:trypsin 5G1-like [Trichoplusia ni]|nr:trypsin 5G1-like [Trichoplusia ni]